MLADDAWRLRVEGRFWPKVMKPLDWEACWPWTGATKRAARASYGNFKLKSYVAVVAPRISYALFHNRSPGKLMVCHTCDNPSCVNPSHLFLGTAADNAADMVAKGRHRSPPQKGEQNGAAKLSNADVEKVRDRIRVGFTNVRIAAEFGVTHQAISRIRRGRSWGAEPMQPKYASLKASRGIT